MRIPLLRGGRAVFDAREYAADDWRSGRPVLHVGGEQRTDGVHEERMLRQLGTQLGG